MRSRFLLGMSWMLSSAIYLSSCTSGGGKSGAGGSSSTQPVIDASGKKIYTVDPSTGATISASGISSSDSRFANAAVVIPPGALSIPVDISIFQAQSLVSSSTSAAVGSSNLTAAGPAVAVLPSQPVSISNPLAISLPYSALTSLSGEQQLIVIAIYPGEGKNELETFLGSELDLSAEGLVKISITRFGAFQVIYSSSTIQKMTVKTEIEIEQHTTGDNSNNNPYSAYVGKWGRGCSRSDHGSDDYPIFTSQSVDINADQSGAGKAAGMVNIYNDPDCMNLVAKEVWIQPLKFLGASKSVVGAHEVDSSMSDIFITLYSDESQFICNQTIQPEVETRLTSVICQNDERYRGRFESSKDIVKVVGNMLFTGECPDGNDCATLRPTVLGKGYMTRRTQGEPEFELLGPTTIEDGVCAPFILKKSSESLVKPLRLAQNRDPDANGRFYSDENCQLPLESPATVELALDEEEIAFYYKHSGSPGRAFIDIRDADGRDVRGIFSKQVEIVSDNDPAIDATAFLGNWQSGCQSQNYQSTKDEVEIFKEGDAWKVKSMQTVYSDSDCQNRFTMTTLSQNLTPGTSWGEGLQIDLSTSSFELRNLSGALQYFCGLEFGAGSARTFISAYDIPEDNYCRNNYAGQFAPAKQMIKVVGNMLFAGDCSAQNGNCVDQYPASFESTYMTRVVENEPSFSIVQVSGSSYQGSPGYWNPELSLSDCRKFLLQSDRALLENVWLAQNQNNMTNGMFYYDSSCTAGFDMGYPVMSAGESVFEFYFRPMVNFAPTRVVLDLRDANNLSRGLASSTVSVKNQLTLTATVSDEMTIGGCYQFTVSSEVPFAEPLTINPLGYENSAFGIYGSLYKGEGCSNAWNPADPSSPLVFSGNTDVSFFFKPTSTDQHTEIDGKYFNVYLRDQMGSASYPTNGFMLRILSGSGGGAVPDYGTGGIQ